MSITLPGTGSIVATETIGGADYQWVKLSYGGAGSATLVSTSNGLPIEGRGTAGSAAGGVLTIQGVASMTAVKVDGSAAALGAFDQQASFTRPADTTAYAVNDAMSDSTSAPSSGGFTLTGVARASGGIVMLTDILITSSKPSNLQGILYIFNQAATNTNDNAAFAMSDSDVANAVAILPFALTADASNSWQHLQNLAITALCSGSADLRFLIKLTAAYTPDNAEVIKVRAKGLRLN